MTKKKPVTQPSPIVTDTKVPTVKRGKMDKPKLRKLTVED